MATIGLLMMPQPGHLLPTLRIAHALRANGHVISYITLEHYGKWLISQGFEVLVVDVPGLSEPTKRGIFEPKLATKPFGSALSSHLAMAGLTVADFIKGIVRKKQFDLLLCDSMMRYLVEEDAKCRGQNVIFVHITLPDDVEGSQPNTCCQEVILCPYDLEVKGLGIPPPWRLYGEPSIWRSRDHQTFPWNALDERSRLILCSFGTQCSGYPHAASVMANLIQAAKVLTSVQFVIAFPAHDWVANVKPSRNILFVDSAPQLELLDRASAFVTHGGLGGVKEAILARVPMLVIPFAMDQPRNATRVVHHRLGYRCAPEDCTAERLGELLAGLLADTSLVEEVKAMSQIFNTAEQESLIVKNIKSLLM